jgi:hypothetical protein
LAVPRIFQRPLGRVPRLDLVGSVQRHELGDESGRDGGFGELSEKGRLVAVYTMRDGIAVGSRYGFVG